MLAGIVFQLGEFDSFHCRTFTHFLAAAIVVYMALAVEFIYRYLHDRPVRKVSVERLVDLHYLSRDYKLMLLGLGLSTICIFIRYATVFPSYTLYDLTRDPDEQVCLPYLRAFQRLGR